MNSPTPPLFLAHTCIVFVCPLLSWIICWTTENNQMERRKESERVQLWEREVCCLSACYSSGPKQTIYSPLPSIHLSPNRARALRFSLYALHLFNPPQAALVFLTHTQTLTLQSALSLIDLYFLIFTSATCLLSHLHSHLYSHTLHARSHNFYQMLVFSDWISKSWILLKGGISTEPYFTPITPLPFPMSAWIFICVCVCFAFTIYIKLFHCVCKRTLSFCA